MRQELERALEAIESACKRIDELKAENKTLKEALAQPEQKSQLLFEIDGEMLTASQMMGVELFNFQQATGCDTAAEFLAQPEQEPVAWESILGAVARGWCYEENANKTMDSDLAVAIAKEVQALYTTPPQRKPLTVEQIDELAKRKPNWSMVDFARAIEAAHNIKE